MIPIIRQLEQIIDHTATINIHDNDIVLHYDNGVVVLGSKYSNMEDLMQKAQYCNRMKVNIDEYHRYVTPAITIATDYEGYYYIKNVDDA